jgi:two-component system response regulator PilR (NtrC family)
MSPSPATQATVLVIEDEPDLLTLYELTLLREGYKVDTADTLGRARQRLEKARFDIVLTDMHLPDGNGMDLLREMTTGDRPERWIMVTAYGSAENAVEALKAGAFDYLTKPVELKQFRTVMRSALQTPFAAEQPEEPLAIDERPGNIATAPSAPAEIDASPLAHLVGNSEAMRAVKARIVMVAKTMAPVLITGESGTGKELAARALHDCSHRANGPFVPVNCGAIPENLLEAEFFGARKGAYTGASHDRKGFFQAANHGTLFLDEIGDLPLSMQAKLLRAIQERRVRPLGATEEEAVDVRIVSATHKVLADEVRAERFRHDLFYRLNVISMTLPPLRERREDIPAICDALLKRIAAQTGEPAGHVTPRQLEQIMAAPLNGNVRELDNLLQRALALGDDADLGGSDFDTARLARAGVEPEAPAHQPAQPALAAPAPLVAESSMTLSAWLDDQERQIITQALRQAGPDAADAAVGLGLSLRQLQYRMERLGVHAPDSDARLRDPANRS